MNKCIVLGMAAAMAAASTTVFGQSLPYPSPTTLGGVNSLARVPHVFMNGIGTNGVPQATQPTAGDIQGLAPSATIDTTNASNIKSGTLPWHVLPMPSSNTLGGVVTTMAPLHYFLTGISSSGAPQTARPSAADIQGLAASATTDTTNATNINKGILSALRLPAPTTSTPGGIRAILPVPHQWMTGISSSGTPQLGQPATKDLSDIGTFTLATTGKASLCSTSRHGGASVDLSYCSDSIMLPAGNTGQRPGVPALGMIRLNSDSGLLEGYQYTHHFASGVRLPTWSSLLNDSLGPVDVTSYPYNVVCDGSTDNTAAMQAAAATGRDLYIPQFAAACVFGDVVLRSRQRIFGYGTQVQTPPGAMFAFQLNGGQSISGIRFSDGAVPGEMVIATTDLAAPVGANSLTTTPEAVFTATLSGTTLTVTAVVSGTLTKNLLLADAGSQLPAGTRIVSQTSGTTGGPGNYTVNNAGNVPAIETMAGTRFQVGQRGEVQLFDGHRWGAWITSVSETTSDVTIGISRPLPAPVNNGGQVWAGFGVINVTCSANLWNIKDISWVGTAWAGVVAGCPSNTALPVGMGKIYNLAVGSGMRAFFIAIGPNENSINVNEIRFNGGWTQTLNFTGDGAQTAFTGSEVMFSGKPSSTLDPIVTVNGAAQTYPAQFTISPDGRSIIFATAPDSGAGVTIMEKLLGSEGIVIDSTGSAGGSGANGNTVTAQGGGFEVPYGVFNAPGGAAAPTNVFNNIIGDPALDAIMVFDGNQNTTVNDARLQYASKASLKILNGARVLGDIDCNPPGDPSVLTNGGVGVCAVIDPASRYSGHLRNMNRGGTELFDAGVPVMYTGSPPPARNSGSCTVSNGGNPVPAGSYAIPCVSPSGTISNGELWAGGTSYLPAWDTVQHYDGSANIYLTDRTTGSIPDGTVLTFAGPSQPRGAFGPITFINGTAPADNGACSTGQVQLGTVSRTTYLFICTSQNTWQRSALSSY